MLMLEKSALYVFLFGFEHAKIAVSFLKVDML